ncbi:MAG: PEGA domain-containing protein [Sandaracinaceae bacterium]|nr:PEGA domain-containing protein [Sandaracinaceae bacterium]
MPIRLIASTLALAALTTGGFTACAASPRPPLVGFAIAVPQPRPPLLSPATQRASRPCVRLAPAALASATIGDLVETFLERNEMRCPARTLAVTTDPAGARVSVDGRELGTTPLAVRVPEGESWLFLFELDGYEGVAAEPPEYGDVISLRLHPIPREPVHVIIDPPRTVQECQLPPPP